jgi:hypothetical protein
LLVGGAALALVGCKGGKGNGGGGDSVAPATSAPGSSTVPSATQPASFNTLGPGSLWNGTPGSGFAGAPPQDPTRTTAKPVLHWWQPSQIRGVGPTLIGVIADAKGGISHVDFYVEGNVQANVTQTYYTDTDVNGLSRTRPFWGINVDCAAACAAHPTGAIRVYAKAYANDGTIQPRVIGPLTIYPRATAYDWDKTVAASGADYTTLAAAMQAMKDALTTGGKECGRVTITQTGTYDMGSPDVYQFPWSYGMSCITTSSGVTATIVRGTGNFDGYRGGVPQGTWNVNDPWVMFTYVDNIEFRGGGIVIDRKNFARIASSPYQNTNPLNLNPVDGSQNKSGNYLFNGCKITNSAGSWPQTYWNGGPAPSLYIMDLNGDPCTVWGQDCIVEYQFSAASFFQDGSVFNKVRKACGAGHIMPNFIYGEYYTDSTKATEDYYNSTIKNGMSITYSGANATQATAQVVYSDAAKQILLQAPAGITIATLNVRDPQAALWPRVADNSYFVKFSDLVAYINAHNGSGGTCQGFQATLIDDTIPLVQMGGRYGGGGFTQNVKGVPYTIQANYGMHTEWIVWQNGPTENALVWNCTVFNSGWSTSWVNWGGGAGHFKDISFKNNTFDYGSSTTHNLGNGGSTFGSHACMENVTMTDVLQPGQGFGTDSYSRITQVVALQTLPWNGSWSDNIPTNCVTAGDNVGPGTGMVNVNSGGAMNYSSHWSPLFANNAAEDWTPAPGWTLATHLFATVNPWAADMAQRGASDAAGAWKVGGNAPSWVF